MFELSKLSIGDPRHPPLIFLHGFLGAKEDWEEILPYFKDRFYCIAYDLPGHGRSPYSEDILTAIRQILQKIEGEKPICIGYSLGGRIALQIQDCAKAVIALSAHPGLSNIEDREHRLQIDKEWSDKLLSLSFEDFLSQWYAQPIFHRLNCNADLMRTLESRRAKQNPQDLSRVLLQMSLSHQKQITEFSCPTLFLCGEEDLKYRELYCRLPKTVNVGCIKSSSHAIHLENPKNCVNQINKWIEEFYANP